MKVAAFWYSFLFQNHSPFFCRKFLFPMIRSSAAPETLNVDRQVTSIPRLRENRSVITAIKIFKILSSFHKYREESKEKLFLWREQSRCPNKVGISLKRNSLDPFLSLLYSFSLSLLFLFSLSLSPSILFLFPPILISYLFLSFRPCANSPLSLKAENEIT